MKKIIILLLLFVVIGSVNAQSWKTFSRKQKDSVIYTYYQKGHKYLALGIDIFGVTGKLQGFGFVLEPVWGYLIKDRNLLYLSLAYEQAYLQNIVPDTVYYRKHRQYSIGSSYRIYLPERKIYISFFIQGGLRLVYYNSDSHEITGFHKTSFFDLMIPFEAGISIPINRFNLELSIAKRYRLFHGDLYEDSSPHRFLGNIRISYIIK